MAPVRKVSSGASAGAVIVAIAGGSGSGKSWLCELLAAGFGGDIGTLTLDDFYLDRSHVSAARRARLNFDHPRAIDWRAVEKSVRTLREGLPAQAPKYDFSTHCRVPGGTLLSPKPIILVEGLWPLRRPLLRSFFDLRIFLECAARTRLARRMKRDVWARGRTRASVREQFRRTVEPMHRRFVAPQARWADVILREGWGMREAEFLAAVIRYLLRRKAGEVSSGSSRGGASARRRPPGRLPLGNRPG